MSAATSPALNPSPAIDWHALDEAAALEKLSASRDGLTPDAAAARLREFGPNVLPAAHPPSLFIVFLHQFASPLIYILLAAGVVAVVIGDASDAAFIFGVVLLNAGLGAWQEWRAEKSAASLQQLLRVSARVRRQGRFADISAHDLVPGDIVLLESGARVPADLRLLDTNGLSIDESFLTGESLAVEKSTAPLPSSTSVADRRNLAFAGAIVAAGRGLGVVVATALRTEVGKIANSVSSARAAKPPLLIRMEQFATQVSWAVLGACLLLAAVALARGMHAADVFFFAIALAVAAIPEGLPVAITVALSIATHRMVRRNVIVRRLTAVEGLGSCTFIASDKTGTLTLNKQTVQAVWLPSGGRFLTGSPAEIRPASGEPVTPLESAAIAHLTRLAMIASETAAHHHEGQWRFAGDAVDVAFWDLSLRLPLDVHPIAATPKAGEIPFESERAFAAAFYFEAGQLSVAVKGAPEVILARCRSALGPAGPEPLDRAEVDAEIASLTASGHRVMAIAAAPVPAPSPGRPLDDSDLPPLQLVGLAALIDPPRTEVRFAVEKCRHAGIEVAMITGDHPLTALAIARDVGIQATGSQVVTGRQLAELGPPTAAPFLDAVRSGRVFARVSPLQKLQIVEALGALGHFVAVTGDGVNDAPALKRAHIGIAMGSGTDVTKDSASIIVTDDNFASIEAGVEEGRFAYDNIRKVTFLLISTGFAEVVLFFLAILSGMPLPLLPVQLLWLNLVTNGIQHVSLAFEGGEPGAMKRPPRPPSEGIFNRLMIQQTVVAGATMALVAFAGFHLLLNHFGFSEFQARNIVLLLMVLMENYHVFNCRSEYVSALRVPLRRNWMLAKGVLAAQALHIAAMFFPPARDVLSIGPVSWLEWLLPCLAAASVLLAMEIFKWRKHGRALAWPSSVS